MNDIVAKMALDDDDAATKEAQRKAKDMSDLVDKKLPEYETLAKLCRDAKQWNVLNENLTLLSKRRGQLKTALASMVQQAMDYLDTDLKDDEKTRTALLETLMELTKGKIYVEIERARLSRKLAAWHEAKGDIAAASKTLREVQVETFGAMDKVEKTEYILEQMRLCMDDNDFIRAQILSRKISRKVLQEEGMEDLSVRFYRLMIRFHMNDTNFLEIARSFRAIYDNKATQQAAKERDDALRHLAAFAVLSPWSNDASDLLNRVATEKPLRDMPLYETFVKLFLTLEIVRWPIIKEQYVPEFQKLQVFAAKHKRADGSDIDLWQALQDRIVQHNLRVVAGYYTRITLQRLASLLDLSEDKAEEFVCKNVSNKTIGNAKIDRPTRIVTFQRYKDSATLLDEWGGQIDGLLSQLETSLNKIQREKVLVAKVKGN